MQPKFWNLIFKIDVIFGYFRGKIYFLFGYILHRNEHGLYIGPTHRSFFEKDAKIILQPSSSNPPNNAPDDFHKIPYSIGILNPQRYQNPPSRESRFRLLKGSKLILSKNVRIGPGFYISIGDHVEVKIGSWTYIGSDCNIHCRSGINIGDRCMFSHGITFMDYDGHQIAYEGQEMVRNKNIEVDFGKSSSIVIEDDVWIGANVMILKGVHISKGSMIAANSCVTDDVPSNSLVAGNPAKIVKENIKWKHF